MSNCSNDDSQSHEEATSDALAGSHPEASVAKRKKAPSPRRCRDFIRREAADAMPEIVTAFVDRAKGGSVPHFASLAKVGGFDQRPSSEAPKRRGKSLGRQLLDEVEKYEAKQAAQLAAAREATSQIETGSDNGKPQEKA
jgi:hypothetical protein